MQIIPLRIIICFSKRLSQKLIPSLLSRPLALSFPFTRSPHLLSWIRTEHESKRARTHTRPAGEKSTQNEMEKFAPALAFLNDGTDCVVWQTFPIIVHNKQVEQVCHRAQLFSTVFSTFGLLHPLGLLRPRVEWKCSILILQVSSRFGCSEAYAAYFRQWPSSAFARQSFTFFIYFSNRKPLNCIRWKNRMFFQTRLKLTEPLTLAKRARRFSRCYRWFPGLWIGLDGQLSFERNPLLAAVWLIEIGESLLVSPLPFECYINCWVPLLCHMENIHAAHWTAQSEYS